MSYNSVTSKKWKKKHKAHLSFVLKDALVE